MPKRSLKGGALLAPVPAVMVSVGDENEKNIITVAWCGTVATSPAKTYISVRPSRHSYDIIKRTGEFVINLVPAALAKTADYCGIYTGAKVNKFEKCHLSPGSIEGVTAPTIEECPLSIACRVTDIIPMGGTHDMFLADIVAVNVDEKALDDNNKLRMDKCSLLAYAHGDYFALGKKVGNFGFSVKKKHKSPSRRSNKRLK